jgi:hypothetical protein
MNGTTMRNFHCDHCQQQLFFENFACVNCGRQLAYLQDLETIASLDPTGDGVWSSPLREARGRTYRLCANYAQHDVCNWALPTEDPNDLCRSCRLTRVIPDLSQPGFKEAWYRLEVAKRRLVFTLLELGLPVLNKVEDPEHGIAYEFLADPVDPQAPMALTGHTNGVITINVAEADDPERERRRLALHEPYRTLLGHFRHEVGHYYWDRLIAGAPRLEPFRAMFGDEREDYAQALERHYQQGSPADWQQRYVSQYASSHPWEDWAETWAHYVHMVDTLETAAACGLALRPRRADEPALETDPHRGLPGSFEELIEGWYPLTFALNSLNRCLGLPDGYPFVLSDQQIAKLRFVHDTIAGTAVAVLPQPPPEVAATARS